MGRPLRLPRTQRRQLSLIAIVQVLAMSVWFSAAAVVPSLQVEWGISSGAASWLTTSVQLGFVAGALASAVLNLADRLRGRTLIAGAALVAGAANLFVAVASDGLASALPARVVAGVALAGVYPVGVKLIASWFDRGRGFAIGVLVGALTVGSAAPHLVEGLGSLPWRGVLAVTSGLAFAAAGLALALREGPLAQPSGRLRPAYVLTMVKDRRQRLVNLGYGGHMWELYALWTWLPTYIVASLAAWDGGAPGRAAVGALAFAVIGVAGAAGCVVAGWRSQVIGSERVALHAMLASGACCLLSAVVFGAHPLLLVPVLAVWGFAVIADSAQFSEVLSDAADPGYVGTALTTQMAFGFLITVLTIRLLPAVADATSWQWALTALAPGPLAGALAMYKLVQPANRRIEA
jgi:MFS family permease